MRNIIASNLQWLFVLLLLASRCRAWMLRPISHLGRLDVASGGRVFSTKEETPSTLQVSEAINEEEDDEEEYEYIEYESLTEPEFLNSEWLVGTNWDNRPDRIDETWARLVTDRKGKNVVVWGDGSEGTWSLDVASQFLSMSKENKFTGKDIWACSVSDFYYLRGTVRGWKFWSPASVLGQWQAKRLGVEKGEAGIAPWFAEDDGEEEVTDNSIDEAKNNELPPSASA